MFSRLLSVIYWLYFFLTATIWACLLAAVKAITAPFDKEGRIIHWLTSAGAYHYIAINPFWRCRYDNVHLLEENKTCIVVANHQSLSDVLVLSRLRKNYRWVAKSQVLLLPGVGMQMRLNRYISVSQGNLKSVRRMFRQAKRTLANGTSIFIFPEGERSTTGELLEFKEGPFRLACDTDTPVLPVVLDGTREILPRGGWVLNFNRRVEVRLLEPVHPKDADYCPRKLRDIVQTRIESALFEIRLYRNGQQQSDWQSTTTAQERLAVRCVAPDEMV